MKTCPFSSAVIT
uniref:Uncharacterized protein n=1 Tax=Arundo donax TaxID=35708 RepID=A0A0A9GPF8_ARUDO